uniref:Sex pheromone cCF10 n=1 Tax=Enterococcus faecalis TaxID=1351 RepID=CCF1_ENTFL|nr:RecName: Full=Sex pheromone cCF10 [Enterococcus faecalis]2AW6_E Chain E, peptide [synthetic construct]2AW6_F Chain F, peptide [synthetic construct]2AXZ_E Chain E, LVTLVFV peptide2AXZ_F Chain F, LVTLVFV peptide2AXZ_H Chain H, LVTLVFV peptide4FAJ_B Chain B, Sex pheromone cCF10 [Enterococcus faecalis]
LVTLVFV